MSRPTNRARLLLDTLDDRVVMSAVLPTLDTLEPAILVAGDVLKSAPAVPTDSGATKGAPLAPTVPTGSGPTKGDPTVPKVPTGSGPTKGDPTVPTGSGPTKGDPTVPTGSGPTKGDPTVPKVPTGSEPTKGDPTVPKVPTGSEPTKGDPLVPTGSGPTKGGTVTTDRIQLNIGPSPVISLSGAHSLLVIARLTDAGGQPITRAGVYTVYLNGVKQGEFATSTGAFARAFAVPYGAYTVSVTFEPPAGVKGVRVSTAARYIYQAPTNPFGPAKGSLLGNDVSTLFAPIVVD